MSKLKHRLKGYNFLAGNGLEIGALHLPAQVPLRCKVEYCDAITKEQAIQLFPEVDANQFVEVKHICDLDKDGLSLFEDGRFDFVVLNHVIEHVANPIRVIAELFRVTRDGGFVVVSAPDKNYNPFDQNRPLTPYAHLLEEYITGVVEVTDVHYVELMQAVTPEALSLNSDEITNIIKRLRSRHEHAHAWDSPTFADFLTRSFDTLDIVATCVFVSSAEENKLEYFSVWKKGLIGTRAGVTVSDRLRVWWTLLTSRLRQLQCVARSFFPWHRRDR